MRCKSRQERARRRSCKAICFPDQGPERSTSCREDSAIIGVFDSMLSMGSPSPATKRGWNAFTAPRIRDPHVEDHCSPRWAAPKNAVDRIVVAGTTGCNTKRAKGRVTPRRRTTRFYTNAQDFPSEGIVPADDIAPKMTRQGSYARVGAGPSTPATVCAATWPRARDPWPQWQTPTQAQRNGELIV